MLCMVRRILVRLPRFTSRRRMWQHPTLSTSSVYVLPACTEAEIVDEQTRYCILCRVQKHVAKRNTMYLVPEYMEVSTPWI